MGTVNFCACRTLLLPPTDVLAVVASLKLLTSVSTVCASACGGRTRNAATATRSAAAARVTKDMTSAVRTARRRDRTRTGSARPRRTRESRRQAKAEGIRRTIHPMASSVTGGRKALAAAGPTSRILPPCHHSAAPATLWPFVAARACACGGAKDYRGIGPPRHGFRCCDNGSHHANQPANGTARARHAPEPCVDSATPPFLPQLIELRGFPERATNGPRRAIAFMGLSPFVAGETQCPGESAAAVRSTGPCSFRLKTPGIEQGAPACRGSETGRQNQHGSTWLPYCSRSRAGCPEGAASAVEFPKGRGGLTPPLPVTMRRRITLLGAHPSKTLTRFRFRPSLQPPPRFVPYYPDSIPTSCLDLMYWIIKFIC